MQQGPTDQGRQVAGLFSKRTALWYGMKTVLRRKSPMASYRMPSMLAPLLAGGKYHDAITDVG
jgi:hypothetical protein